ncbi:MoxR family ATPase [bacterium]|nr:MoxR family ATPase [bacterium]
MSDTTLSQINSRVESESAFVDAVLKESATVIVGQRYVMERLLMGILSGGHLLLEGVPGLAKTLAIKTLASVFHVNFKRVQFTPDLLPADILGTLIYDQAKHEFVPKLGPIFSNLVLADEINRAPAKVQSALLEAMQERQVTLGDTTYTLPDPFLVLATQNPIDEEGTYPLPEAQVDRFLMKLKVTYPTKAEERSVIDRMMGKVVPEPKAVASADDILRARKVLTEIYVDDKIKDYVLDIVGATRNPIAYNLPSLGQLIRYGASPRASLALVQAGRAHAFINRRGYVTPDDIKAVGPDVLRHRVIPSFEADAEGINAEAIIDRIFAEIAVP